MQITQRVSVKKSQPVQVALSDGYLIPLFAKKIWALLKKDLY